MRAKNAIRLSVYLLGLTHSAGLPPGTILMPHLAAMNCLETAPRAGSGAALRIAHCDAMSIQFQPIPALCLAV